MTKQCLLQTPMVVRPVDTQLPSVQDLSISLELPLRQLDLLPGLEGRHAQVGAAGAAERVAQVTLKRKKKKKKSRLNEHPLLRTCKKSLELRSTDAAAGGGDCLGLGGLGPGGGALRLQLLSQPAAAVLAGLTLSRGAAYCDANAGEWQS